MARVNSRAAPPAGPARALARISWVEGAMQLLSKRSKYIRFAHVHERTSFSSSEGDNQRFILNLLTRDEAREQRRKLVWLELLNRKRRGFVLKELTPCMYVCMHTYIYIYIYALYTCTTWLP